MSIEAGTIRSQKDVLINQALRCRERLQMLKDTRDRVVNVVDEACVAVNEAIDKMERAIGSAESAQMKALGKELRNISNIIRKYEDALEQILDLGDDDDDRFFTSIAVGLEGPAAVRDISLSEASSTTNSRRLSPSPFQMPAVPVASVQTESDLIRFHDTDLPPPSPSFETAESCGDSSFADATSDARSNSACRMPIATTVEPVMPQEQTIAQEVQVNQTPAPPPIQNVPTNAAVAENVAMVCSIFPQVTDGPSSNEIVPTEVTYPSQSLSGSVESPSTSPGDHFSSSETYSVDDEFVEGSNISNGQFYFADDNSVRFYMRHIVSPDEFYVQPLSHETSAAFSQLRRELSLFYDIEENRKPLVEEGSTSFQKGMFAVSIRRGYYTNDQDIERCEVLSWRECTGASRAPTMKRVEVYVRFLDLGVKQWVEPSQLWKIDQRFCQIPALTIQCRLFDTRPRDEGIGTVFGCWNDEAVSKFKALCACDRPMTAFVMNKREPFGLMVYVYRGLTKECLNAALVSEKVAKTLANFSRAADLVSDHSNGAVRENREEVSGVNTIVDFLCFGAEARPLPPPAVNSTVLVEVQKFFTCCRFSVNFPTGVGDIYRLRADPQYRAACEDPIWRYKTGIDEMNNFYANDSSLVFQLWPLVGQMVASKFSVDERYYRARLLDVAPQDHSARVRYVDYGNDEWCSISSLRPLTSESLSLPYMAMECILAGLRPLPRVCVNGDNINALMEEIRSHSPEKRLLARVVGVVQRPPPAGPLLSVILTTEDRTVNFNDFVVARRWAERE